MWINNCVGEKNYVKFLAMTISTFFHLTAYVIGMILLWTQNQWEKYLGSMVTVWVYSFLIVIFAILLINLIGLHFYLVYKGITTYQFIMLQREQDAKKKQQQEQAQQQQIHQNMGAVIMEDSHHQTNQIHQKMPPRQSSQERIVSMGVNRVPSARHSSNKHENTGEVVFGLSANQNEIENNRTQKSEEMNQRNHHNPQQKIQTQQNNYNQEDDPSSLNSKAENIDNISNYFAKNKSLKFFIGDQIGSRPKSTKKAQILSKEKLFRSARAVQMESRNDILHQSENQYRQKSFSIQIKEEKQAKTIKVLEYQQKRQIVQ